MGNSNGTSFNEIEVDPFWKDEYNQYMSTVKSEKIESTEIKHSIHENIGRKIAISDGNSPFEISKISDRRRRIIFEKKAEFDRLRAELKIERENNKKLQSLLKNLDPKYENYLKAEEVELQNIKNADFIKISELVTENQQLKAKITQWECRDRKEVLQANDENRKLQIQITKLQTELQNLKSEIHLLEKEKHEYHVHLSSMKDVIKISKELLEIRENQITQLTIKNEQLQKTLTDKDIITYSYEMRQEYERQLKNIKELRVLYEEKQAATEAAKEKIKKDLILCQKDLKEEKLKSEEMSKRIEELEKDNSEKYDKIAALELNFKMNKAECDELQAQLTVINQLFSDVIIGFRNGRKINFDELIDVLEKNHDLLTDIVINEDSCAVSSSLPKVLLDLINRVKIADVQTEQDLQICESQIQKCIIEENASTTNLSINSAAEIVQTLPKVWRLLAELLSQHQIHENTLSTDENDKHGDPCYKLVQTTNGPTLVLSVSGTFIRLKNLILEKKSLEKETFHLKQLNTHLESRLQDQEKRLGMVTIELSKTWNVVEKMQKQHQQLHTQEKILRYELAQKRKLLTDLKDELEYCREKWLRAREKNDKTEAEWKELRQEFTNRKKIVNDDLNNSAESGYSDDRELLSDEDDGIEPSSSKLITFNRELLNNAKVSTNISQSHVKFAHYFSSETKTENDFEEAISDDETNFTEQVNQVNPTMSATKFSDGILIRENINDTDTYSSYPTNLEADENQFKNFNDKVNVIAAVAEEKSEIPILEDNSVKNLSSDSVSLTALNLKTEKIEKHEPEVSVNKVTTRNEASENEKPWECSGKGKWKTECHENNAIEHFHNVPSTSGCRKKEYSPKILATNNKTLQNREDYLPQGKLPKFQLTPNTYDLDPINQKSAEDSCTDSENEE